MDLQKYGYSQVEISYFNADIVNGKWNEETSQTLGKIEEWKVSQLHLGINDKDIENNQRSTVVKEISHIQFTCLTRLWLDRNHIQSIQCLSRIHIPHIQALVLSHNQYFIMSGLRKAKWPSLSFLSLHNTFIQDPSTLTQAAFFNLRQLWVYYCFGNDSNLFLDSSFPAKLQTPSLRCLGKILQNSGIKCKVFDLSNQAVFIRKWPNVKIY